MAPSGSHGAVVEVHNFLLEFGLCFGSDLAAAREEPLKSPRIWFGKFNLDTTVHSTLGLETAKRQTGQGSRPRFREACDCKTENDAIAKLD